MSDTEAPELPSSGLSDTLFAEAARGSLSAQRSLRDRAMQMAASGYAPFDQACAVAEVFARLASSRGEGGDLAVLAELLLTRAELLAQEDGQTVHALAEALCTANRAADVGSEEAGLLLARITRLQLPQELFDLAQEMGVGSTPT